MFASAYMGRKRCFSNAFTPFQNCSLWNSCVYPHAKAFEGATPRRFRPTYAEANPDFLLRGFGIQPRVRLSSRKAA
jgi:hypothetical protein